MVDKDDLIPSNFKNSTKVLDANWGPQSDMILSSSPKCLYRLSNNNCAVCLAVIVFEQGMRIIPFVNPWSITTRMESCPFTSGKSGHLESVSDCIIFVPTMWTSLMSNSDK